MQFFKKNIKQISAIAGFSFCLTACDKVENTIAPKPPAPPAGYEGRKILMEEFTGHTCIPCLAGHQEIKEMEEIFGEKLIVVSFHAGGQSNIEVPTYTYDFRTSEGTALFNNYSVLGTPRSLVNRTFNAQQSAYWFPVSAWRPAVFNADTDLKVKINVTPTYNPNDSIITVKLKSTFASDLSGTYNIVAYLIEDSIIKPQKLSATAADMNYVHRHVFRKSFNTLWGEQVAVEPEEDETSTKTYTMHLGSDWDPNHCNVVAYIYKDGGTSTSKEIIMAEEEAIK